jgi:hypothetical protein
MAGPVLYTATTITPEWSEVCWAFLEFWKSLRAGALMPATEAFLDAVPPHFMRNIYIIDVLPDESRVRFQSTEIIARWGFDATGGDVVQGRSAKLKAQVIALLAAMTAHRCGYYTRTNYMTARERPINTHLLRLPLAVKAGRPPRVVNFTESQFPTDGEDGWTALEVLEHGWLDLGAGVPARAPVGLST